MLSVYKLTFKQTGIDDPIEQTIRTNADVNSKDKAVRIFINTRLQNVPGSSKMADDLKARLINIEEIPKGSAEHQAVVDELTIIVPYDDECKYAIAPDAAVRTILVREDINGNSDTLVDIVMIPSNVYNMSCDKRTVYALFQQIVTEFHETPAGQDMFGNADSATYDDLVNIPDEFLKRYGVAIEPIDVPMSIHVSRDEDVCEF